MDNKINRGILIAGLQQSGKTYFTEQLCKKKNLNGFSCVYNIGRVTDWSFAIQLTPITPDLIQSSKQQKAAKDRFHVVDFWKDESTGKIWASRDIPKIYKGKTVKIYRSQNYEKQVINCFYEFWAGGLIIFDDFRVSTRFGLKDYHIQLFSRQNHTGAKYFNISGMDIVFVYHNLDTPPGELYDYISHLILFKLNSPPKPPTGEHATDEAIFDAIENVNKLPRFSYAAIQIRDCEKPIIKYFKPNTATKINTLNDIQK